MKIFVMVLMYKNRKNLFKSFLRTPQQSKKKYLANSRTFSGTRIIYKIT